MRIPVACRALAAVLAATYGVRRLGDGGVEFRVTGDPPFAARAADPVLRVGDVVVRRYRHDGGALVFTLPDASALRDGAPVSLGWEPGGRGRLELPALRLQAIEEAQPR